MLRIDNLCCTSVLNRMLILLLLAGPVYLQAGPDEPRKASPYGLIVREIRIEGLQVTREEIVRSQLVSQAGSPYTEATAQADYRWLDRLGVFSSINITPVVSEDAVLLVVNVKETPRILPYPSFNITGENGLSAGFGAKLTSFLHRAIAVSASARFGPLTEAELLMQSPWRRAQRSWFALQYNYRDRPNESFYFHENAREFDSEAGIKFRENWRVGGRFAFISMKSDKPGITLSQDNHDFSPALGAVLEYDGRDLRSNPHRGWQSSFAVTQNSGFIGGDGNFVTAQFDVRRYQPLAARHVVALFSYASLQSGDVGTEVPVYRTYSIGGTNTVRGWNLNARQGKNQFLNTVEYRYDLLLPKSYQVHGFGFYLGVQLAAFGDLGTAWDAGSDFTRNMIAGGGFGLRLIIPFVDVVRLDFGFGQSGKGILPCIGIREKAYYGRQRVR